MNAILKHTLFPLIVLGCVLPAFGQSARAVMREKVDAVIGQAYAEAAARFPCKLKTSGKAKMGRWKDVENCVNPAHDLVNWEDHAARLRAIRDEERVTREELEAVVEAALTARALNFDQVFIIKKNADKALLPLSNSLLKFLPETSLLSLPVYDPKGTLIGAFAGIYASERSGGLEVLNGYRMVNFQYTDPAGNIQTPTETFLLDSFGVPWRDARTQPGFRLPSTQLLAR